MAGSARGADAGPGDRQGLTTSTKGVRREMVVTGSPAATGRCGAGLRAAGRLTRPRGSRMIHRLWPNDYVPGETAQLLPLPRHFAQVSELVTNDRVAAPGGPDPEPYLAAVREYEGRASTRCTCSRSAADSTAPSSSSPPRSCRAPARGDGPSRPRRHGRRRRGRTSSSLLVRPASGCAPPGWPFARRRPRSTLTRRRVTHPALPLRPRHGYAANIYRGLPSRLAGWIPSAGRPGPSHACSRC
jgi:hypothetical protein